MKALLTERGRCTDRGDGKHLFGDMVNTFSAALFQVDGGDEMLREVNVQQAISVSKA